MLITNIKRLNTDYFVISINRQKGFANLICSGDLQSGSKMFGLPTIINTAFARETATLKRLGLYKNSIPLGASSGEELHKL